MNLIAVDRGKFQHPDFTADGKHRARVELRELRTVWFNTGTLCNLTCRNCYIESSPVNDRLVYLTAEEVASYLDEMCTLGLKNREIGFTGGEPFMNPDIIAMLEDSLSRGHQALVLTNAMRPMMKLSESLAGIGKRFPEKLVIRVSLDHYTKIKHEQERGKRSWEPTLNGLSWLSRQNFTLHVAGRTCWGESEESLRRGFRRLFEEHRIRVDALNPAQLILFPEMDSSVEVPEITTECWSLLGIDPDSIMCATSRMVVRHKGADGPVVAACTLLPYDPQFTLGKTLVESMRAVKLNHVHCAKFCVLGGGSCSQ